MIKNIEYFIDIKNGMMSKMIYRTEQELLYMIEHFTSGNVKKISESTFARGV